MKKQLLPWQESCLREWEGNNFRGIVHVVTGAGKTILATAAIELLQKSGMKQTLRVKIVVPKTFLMYQWHAILREELNIPREDIGFFSGPYKSRSDKMVMLYVVNSARDVLARHIIDDIREEKPVLLIADECHHYGSKENARIFGYAGHIDPNRVYTLGLSATPWCNNYNEVLVPSLGEEIYRFGFIDALQADIISSFSLFNIRISFSPEELNIYEELSDQLAYTIYRLCEVYPELRRKKGQSFFTALEDVIRHSDQETADLARTVLHLTMQRKEVVYKAKYRTDCVVELVRRMPKAAKIIIFGERIETAAKLSRLLDKFYPNEVGVYHSKVPKTLGTHILRQFEDGDIRILVSCRTLDEGLNVADADVGIIVSSTGSRRQRLQRLGRVLRKNRGQDGSSGSRAYFYYLYVGDTTEEEELLQEITRPEFNLLINRINLQYEEEIGTFENDQFKLWELAILEEMTEKGRSPEEAVEFMRNADKGLLTEDWLMPEELCQEKIRSANRLEDRNYYIAMLLIIRKRLKRLYTASGTLGNVVYLTQPLK